MKCFNCNEEMIYRDDIRGLEHADMPYGINTNSLIVKKTEIMEGLFSKKRSGSKSFYQSKLLYMS